MKDKNTVKKNSSKKATNKSTIAALSNPFSTGGGGGDFEQRVGATFILALLVEGLSPLLNSKITELIFQSKRLNYDIDDITVISVAETRTAKLLCQIKHGVEFTNNKVFKEVLAAAWNDFNKANFDKKNDKIVLITGFSPKSDVMRFIYTQANASVDAKEFIQRIQQKNYSNEDNRKKLELIKECLKAQKGQDITDQELWDFCKVFSILVFDMAYENSVNDFLIKALITSNSKSNSADAWYRLMDCASVFNKEAAHVTIDNIPYDVRTLFEKEILNIDSAVSLDRFSPDIFWAKLALIGSWNEKNNFDKTLIEDFLGETYISIQNKIQTNTVSADPYIYLNNGVWEIKNRILLLEKCSTLYFDNSIEKLFKIATVIFQQKDKRINTDGTFSLLIPQNGSFDYSDTLRKSLLNGLAQLCNTTSTVSCSDNFINQKAFSFVRDILNVSDSSSWKSLDSSLVTIAEIHPAAFLDSLEKTILSYPETIEALFPTQKTNLLFSRNSICSILWAIECLAWDEKYLIKCIRILGALASLKQEKTNLANTPINSIIHILLPWHPQTLASIEKQKNAMKCLQNEYPQIAWKTIKSLLPNSTTTTTGTNKPKYILHELSQEITVTYKQLFELHDYYAEIAINLAKQDINKLHDLLNQFEHMSKESICLYLQTIVDMCQNWNDEEKYPVWSKMLIYRSKISNTSISSDKDILTQLECVINATIPSKNIFTYRLLFEFQYFDDETSEESTSKWEHKKNKQKEIPIKIYKEYDIETVIKFGNDVKNLATVASYLGQSLSTKDLSALVKLCYEENLDKDFLSSVLWGFYYANEPEEIYNLQLEQYTSEYTAWIFTRFPIQNEVFTLVDEILANNQSLYWEKIHIPYLGVGEDVDVNLIWNKLIQHNRPVSAINLFGINANNCNISFSEIENILILAANTNNEESLDPDAVRNLIAYLQSNASVDIITMSNIEVIYLNILDDYSAVKPKALNYRLANDPQFFCNLIELMYKKKSESSHKQKLSEAMEQRLFEIFFKFKIIPGTDWNGLYHEEVFNKWISFCKEWASAEDRLDIVLQTIGNGLSYAQESENGLIDEFITKELNKPDNAEMRYGFRIGKYNQRGVTWIDPEGKPELKLANKYKELASKVEDIGYSRFAETLREISNKYVEEAAYNIKNYNAE